MLVYVAYWPHPYRKACHQQLSFESQVTEPLNGTAKIPGVSRSMELDGTTDLPPESGWASRYMPIL